MSGKRYLFLFLLIFVARFKEGIGRYNCSKFPSCQCVYPYRRISIYCDVADKLEMLPALFKDMEFAPIDFFKLRSTCTADSLPGNIFPNTSIIAITILCPFKSMNEYSLSVIESLEFLEMRNSNFRRIPSAIGKVKWLTHLKLQKGQLSHVGQELHNMVNLYYLSLESNRIQTVEGDAFIHNRKLRIISLNFNKIRSFYPGTFRSCRNIRVFKVTYNRLKNTTGFPESRVLEVTNCYYLYICNK